MRFGKVLTICAMACVCSAFVVPSAPARPDPLFSAKPSVGLHASRLII